MGNYKFLKKGAFESLEKFEKKLNDVCLNGWKAISFTDATGQIIVLLEKVR